MLIREVKKQPDSKIVEFEGQVRHCCQPDLEGGKWRQLITLNDRTGSIRVTLDHGTKHNPVSNGACVHVRRGKMKDGAVEVLEFAIPTTSEPPAGSPYEYKPDNEMTKTDWEAKDKRMAKMCSLNNATALVVCIAEISGNAKVAFEIDHVKDAACKFLDWIYET